MSRTETPATTEIKKTEEEEEKSDENGLPVKA